MDERSKMTSAGNFDKQSRLDLNAFFHLSRSIGDSFMSDLSSSLPQLPLMKMAESLIRKIILL
jgi:hypothetical protein